MESSNCCRQKGASPVSVKLFWKKHHAGYLYMAPFLILFFIFTLAPLIVSIVISFTNYNMYQTPSFVGLNNYKLLVFDDDVFLIALKNTLLFALITGPIGYVMSFVFAWVINQLRFKTGFALAFYAPSITSSIAMSVVWLYFFSSDRYGLINNFLISMGFISEPILFTQDSQYILIVIIVIQIWMSMGTGFLVFLAGFQNSPQELYEAARIDGISNRFQELYYITVPLMKPQLLFGAINSIVGSLGVFDIAVAIAGIPSPNYAAHTIVAHMYDYAFIRFQMGYSSAVSVVLFLITFFLGKIVMRLLRSDY